MLVANLEVWPGGDESKKRTVGHVLIGNDGTTGPFKANYDVALSHSGRYYGKKGLWLAGRVQAHNRELSPYHLLRAGLDDALTRKLLQPSASVAKSMIRTLERMLAKKSDPQGTLFTGEV